VGSPYLARDTLFLPLHWLSELVPRLLPERYVWDPVVGRLAERSRGSAAPIAATMGGATATARNARPTGTPHAITGLRRPHTVVIDPGHGGRDPGNPGRYFPRGLAEKHVTLAIGRLLRAELERRGLTALLTRATDTLVDLADRGAFCRADCDLFVSIHVNSLPNGRGRRISGVETYFLSAAKTEDQARVARMENDAIRFEGSVPAEATEDLSFILRDLQQNEHLRESARAAELIQGKLGTVHPGGDRGVQQAGFMVLSTARRPAVLIEAGFATHAGDAEFLASALGQRKLVNAVADGIVAYLLEFERKIAVGEP
jgi:N-acetylmuramoyl-L-alanine amidase